MSTSKKPPSEAIYLIDSLSLIFQAFYAIRSLSAPDGTPTNAVYGFLRKMQAILRDCRPAGVVAAFESTTPLQRKELYEAYKANREEAPEEFKVQIPIVLRLLEAMRIPAVHADGYEADDVLGTLARRAVDERGLEVVVVSADKDLLQLVGEGVRVLRPTRDGLELYGPEEVREKMGVRPERIVDYLALVGDTSDNIPGVPRIGPKTAVKILEEHDSLDRLLGDLSAVENEKRRKLLEEYAEQARLSYRLATVVCDAPVDADVLDRAACEYDPEAPELVGIYRELGFTSLMPRSGNDAEDETPNGGKDNPGRDASPAPGADPSIRKDYETLRDAAGVEAFVREVRDAGRMAFDTETTALDTMRAGLVGISIAVRPGRAVYIPVGHSASEAQAPLEAVRRLLGPLFADPGLTKIAQNAKFDMRVLARHGMPVRGMTFDTMLASYLLNPEAKHGLKPMALAFLGETMTGIEELIGKGRSAVTMAEVEVDRAAPYACADADMTLRLADFFAPQLEHEGLAPLLREIEMPLVEVLDAMEAEGVSLDLEALDALSRDLHKRADALAAEIFEIAGRAFNVNSPKQVAEVLFDDLGLKAGRRTKTGQSTNIEVLERLAAEHPLPARILEYRQVEKLLGTYADALPKLLHPKTGRIHTSFNQFVAATGRLSSSNPNLQNIPIRTEEGRRIRAAFIPNAPDHLLLSADYSQIELRVLAHVTQDAALIRAFREDADIHALTASRVFGMPLEMVTSEMRTQAKTINFGVIYGMGAQRLARQLDIPQSQAKDFIDEYFAAYPGVAKWKERLIAEATETGFVSTLSGRRRMVPNLTVRNRQAQTAAVRAAVNTPIQGTAADLVKIAMIRLHARLLEEGLAARMVLQVHDELVLSVPEDEMPRVETLVRETMENAMALDVPLKVDVGSGRTWAEC